MIPSYFRIEILVKRDYMVYMDAKGLKITSTMPQKYDKGFSKSMREFILVESISIEIYSM